MNTERERFFLWLKDNHPKQVIGRTPYEVLYEHAYAIEYGEHQAATIADLQQQLTEANRRGEELVELLKVAKCPNDGCDNNGTIAHQVAYNEWEPEQCQWCDEKATATSKRGGV